MMSGYKKEIRKNIACYADPDDFLIGAANPCSKPVFNVGTLSEYEKERAFFALKFFYDKKVFVVWDLHKHKSHGAKSSLTIGCTWDDIQPHQEMFQDFYKCLGKRNSGIWEKVMVIGFDHFHEFFKNYLIYMTFNEYDRNFPKQKDVMNEIPVYIPQIERKRYSTTQRQRDSKFREKVFSAYNSRCAICRCDVPDLLEAAHERGFEVATTEYDDPQHGICLCANHHLMYDRKLIDIDLTTCTVTLQNECLKKMSWYSEFVSKYNERILERTDG